MPGTSLEEKYYILEVLGKNKHLLKNKEGYAVICDGKLLGFFSDYVKASREARKQCRSSALIVQLPYRDRERIIELGLPWRGTS